MSIAGKAAGVATKATPAGRVAGAAVKHETAKRAGADPRVTAPGSKAAQQRQSIEDIKARREPEPEPHGQADEHEDQADEHDSPNAGGASFGNPLAGMTAPGTGGGFVLGLMVWALVRAYIGNPGQPSGPAGVKRLLNAKLFNKV